MIAVGIGFAVVASCCYAVAAVLQHDAVHTVADGDRLRLAQLRAIAGRRRWLAGLLAMCCGAGLHVMSLSMAPLLVVQPIGVLAIGLATLLANGRTAPDRTTVFAVLASTLGVVLFLALAAPQAHSAALPALAAGRVLPVSAVAVAALVLAAVSARGWVRCPLFATAAGVAYGTVSVLTRAIAGRLRMAGWAGLPLGPTGLAVLGGLVAIVVGAVCVQQAYAGGRADTVLACQTVVDPLIGVLFGVFLFHEATGGTPATAVGELACGALAATGVIALARRRAETSITPRGEQLMDRPLRIVVGADTFPPDINGAARFAHQLATGLAGRGNEVHVLCPSDTGPATTVTMDGVTVHRVAARRTPCHPTFRICLPWQAKSAARALLDEVRPDVVHVQAHFTVGRSLVRAAARRSVPVVATNHFMPENLFGYLRVPGWLRRTAAHMAWRDLARVLRPATVVTAPTPTAVELLHQQGFGGRAIAVSCGVDLARYRADGPGDGRTVLFVGRLDEEKRVDELIGAMVRLPLLRAEIVGDGSCRAELTALAERLGVADRVRFRGFVSDDELVDAYRRCAVFCMPGVAELQSLATMEAMAAGRPVVAADAVALPHLVVPGYNGWLFPPGDVPALAYRLSELFRQPGALTRMGAASRELIARHDVAASLDRFETLYRAALGHADQERLPIAA
ncbi:MAG TPA: glycosyltransferase [Pseudonocardiaceae bacterium]|jgi:glycosyltransferase involved in cell wall biosynthesis|nr:glycosyltransferase [Pseudonocardiaceae bacterium]